MEVLEQYGISPVQAWVAAFVASLLTIAGAAVAFTRQVYWGFLWRYFWGPVHADAIGEDCVAYTSDQGLLTSPESCNPSALEPAGGTAYVAEPGYTIISTLGYISILVFMLVGVYLLLQQFDLTPYPQFFFALVPFMLFGGALRTVEDAFVAAQRAGEVPAVEYPWSALIISPFIYGTVFLIALGCLLASTWLANSGTSDTYYKPLAGMGVAVLSITVGYLTYLSIATDYVNLQPSILVATVGLATLFSVGAYVITDRLWPSMHAGTGLMGLIVLWGHSIDGVANVLANDWTWVWDLGEYGAKHPFNQFIMDATNAIQGGTSIAGIYVGEAWPFALVKIIVPVAILAVFDEEFMIESPRYAVMLLGAIVAVGLGPGTRDMLRIAFGI